MKSAKQNPLYLFIRQAIRSTISAYVRNRHRFSRSKHEPRPLQNHVDTVPEKIKTFDRLYDPHTGGWKCPGWLVDFQLFNSTLAEKWLYACKPNYAPIEREVAHFYKTIVELVRPEVIIETGTNIGYSTSWLAAGLRACCPNGVIYTIDIAEAGHLFSDTGLEQNIQFLRGSSLDVPIDEKIAADMLVLDSDHRYDTVMAEVLRFEPILKVGGFMLFHDSVYFDGVARAVHSLTKSPRFEVITLPTPRTHGYGSRSPGLTLVRKCAPTPAPNDLLTNRLFRGWKLDGIPWMARRFSTS